MLIHQLIKERKAFDDRKKRSQIRGEVMTMPADSDGNHQIRELPPGKTIDLAGVATFASLVELLAQELGTSSGKMSGNLPNGPASFNELVGEIDMNGQGFYRRVTLVAPVGSPLSLRFQVAWNDGRKDDSQSGIVGGVVADYYLGISVEQVMQQGRALARYIEDIFAVMDRMVTLGQSGRLSAMSVSASELQALEQAEGDRLIQSHSGKVNFKP